LDIVEGLPWLRPLQLTFGIIIIFFSVLILLHPFIGGLPLIILISFGLLFAGSEKIITGAVAAKKAHISTIGLGVGVMVVALLAFVFSTSSTMIITLLLGIALIIFGVSRIISNFRTMQKNENWSNKFRIGIGIVSILFGISVIVFSGFGILIASILIGIVLAVNSVLIFTSVLREKPSDDKLSEET